MRCSNCGWENTADATRCVKCNAPIGHSDASRPSYGNSRGYSSVSSGDNSQVLRGTVPEGQIFGSVPAMEQNKVSGSNTCPKCGYLLGRGISSCPRCGCSISGARGSQAVSDSHSSSSRPGTVNPWSKPQSMNECSLTPVPWEGDAAGSPMRYNGSTIVLNRANTDPSNNTITSKVQAELVRESDGWYLTDRSDLQTTFVHAGRKTKLEDGDIVILGNRRFVFKG